MGWWDPENPFAVLVGPSMRMIADLSDPAGLWITNTLGQHGSPRMRHSRDQIRHFLAGKVHQVPASPPRLWRSIEPL
jgi:hypothetical protein